MKEFIKFFKNEEGATAVEYAIMVSFISVIIIAAVVILGNRANNSFSTVGSAMSI